MKKMLSLFLAVLIALTSISTVISAAAAAEDTDPVITADTVAARPGDTVAVNLTIQNNPGILGMTLKVTYDESKVTLTGVANGSTLSYMTFTTPKNLSSGCQLPWDAMEVPSDQVKDGVIATLTFQVSENAAENEEIEIGLSYDDGAIIDNDLAALTIGMVNGRIRIGDNSGGSTGDSPEGPTEDSGSSGGNPAYDSVITVDTVTAQPGEEVEMKLTIKNNPGILGMTLKITYDESKVTLTNVANGDTLSYMTFTTPRNLSSGCQLPWDAMDVPADQVKDGVIATLTIRVSENAAENEEIEIGVSYDAGAIIDNDLNPLDIGVVNGQIIVDAEKESFYTVTYTSASISLAGDIGVNYYAQLSDDIVADEDAYMQFTVAGQTQTVPVSKAVVGDDGTYRFTCKVAAKQMTDEIVGQMYLADGTIVGEAKVYSVKAYCDAAIPVYSQYAAYADLVDLMEAMLNYGGYSQTQFGYNTGVLANAGMDTILPTITAADVDAYAHGATGSEDGISVASVSLLLESTTTIRFYFKLDGTKSIDQYRFYVDGVETAPVESNGQYYVDKVNVAAKDLDEMVTVTVGGLTARYCGLSYVRQVAVLYPSYYSADLINVAKALYAYNQAANAYFG